ncbi:MAG TPA: tetratricopeptide repeat protein [Acidobacteriota bacterium]|nr:tetratricopeptide repeat protein [Acidobacteriota bacterium]HQF88185.1 tetratricopeptide repeat protein [Acidobacteriota bacterium]
MAAAATRTASPGDGEKTEMVIPEGVKAAPDQATEMMTRATPAPSATPAPTAAGGAKDDISKIFETSGVCPNCYATLKKGASQCAECGYRLTGTFCPRCNAQLPDDAKSCPACKWSETSPGTWVPGVAAVPVSAGTIPPGTVPPGPAMGQTVMTPPPAAPALGQTVAAGTAYAPPPAAAPLAQTTYAAPPAAPSPVPAAKKGFPVVLVLVIGLFLLGILAVGGWFGWRYWQQRQAATTTGTAGSGSTAGGTQSTGGSQTGGTGTTMQGFGSEAGAGENLLQQARTYMDSGDYTRALAKVQQHLQDNPGDADAHTLAGQACRALGQADEAIRHFQTALSIQPDNGALRLELGKLYTAGGFSDKAIENYREAVRLLPDNPEPQWCLVQELQKSGDADSARREAEQYVSRYPAGPNRSDADALLTQGQRTRGGRTSAGSTTGGTTAGGATYTGRTTDASRDQSGGSGGSGGFVQPPPPSPYVTVILDGSALNLPGKVAEVTVSFAGIQQRFTSSATARLDNVEKGSHAYNVVVTYVLSSTGEKEFTYSGSGTLLIRYQDQKIRVRRIGERILMD